MITPRKCLARLVGMSRSRCFTHVLSTSHCFFEIWRCMICRFSRLTFRHSLACSLGGDTLFCQSRMATLRLTGEDEEDGRERGAAGRASRGRCLCFKSFPLERHLHPGRRITGCRFKSQDSSLEFNILNDEMTGIRCILF